MTARHWLTICATALGLTLVAIPLDAQQDPTLVLLVRHAERADDGSDPNPELSEIGRARAVCLAESLADAGVDRVFSTNYIRTRRTARPLAERLGVEIETYDPRGLDDFADQLGATGGTVLVVGHSNTTPALVEALGGDPVRPIEHDEYDRLYAVTLTGEAVTSALVRFCPVG